MYPVIAFNALGLRDALPQKSLPIKVVSPFLILLTSSATLISGFLTEAVRIDIAYSIWELIEYIYFIVTSGGQSTHDIIVKLCRVCPSRESA